MELDFSEEQERLRAYSVAPGIVDTDMQKLIRGCSPEQFPMVGKFLQIKEGNFFFSFDPQAKGGGLLSPIVEAACIFGMADDFLAPAQFLKKDFDICPTVLKEYIPKIKRPKVEEYKDYLFIVIQRI